MAQYDSTNMRITDLEVGFLFDYDLKTWEVLEEYEYDWGDDYYTREFKVSDGTDHYFLEIEEDDELKLALYSKIPLLSIQENLASIITRDDEPPKSLTYKGVTLFRIEESLGYWRNVTTSNWSKFVSWDYASEDGKQLLTIERWGEEEYEASVGNSVNEYKFSNVLPREGTKKKAPRDMEDKGNRKARKNFWALLIAIGLVLLLFGLIRASSGSGSSSKFEKNPVDVLISQNMTAKTFTIILEDMDMNSSGWTNTYTHKYMVVKTGIDSLPTTTHTNWVEVDKSFFKLHENDLGMELASKDSTGKVSKNVAPAGYSNYVGNPRYGHWTTNSRGESFWSFYGRYMFMSSMFNMAFHPASRGYYNDYRSNYYGRSSYYGPNNYYGTRSRGMQQSKPDFFERKRRKNNFSSSRSNRSRTSRSSSRRSGSSYRSRSGGFGK